ncbi:protein SFI1 homolog isoform X2 [Sorex araneus]|uniref:protein SFI1 homolog isoform X2 n=1 Tax=Sorex araneus TaxID=42254 RepID=UPI0024334731|nr:protein SFI1 homolog isoform X2 [Sorex araneus]
MKKCTSSHWLNFHQKGVKERMERKVDSRDGAVKKPYSSKIVSNKKNSSFSGIRNKLSSTRHLVPYHVEHTCTRRARLRELRIRCLTRKFLYLWIQKTFGRVFPSKARFYYEQKVLRKVFEGWREEWWVSHREWKLCIRADCHYRYYLYNLMFQTWKLYVLQQQETRNKYVRAEDHDAKQKMRHAWKSWLIYVVFRRTKHEMQNTALEFRQQNILWVWWKEWRQQLGRVRVDQALQASAVKHRALCVQLQVWSRWQEQLLHVRRQRRKMILAVKHHQHWLKWKSLKAWLQHLRIRRVKRQWREMAERFHHVTLLQKHFGDWQWAWERRESLYAHRALVEELARRMKLRRAFSHWKHYGLLCAEEAARGQVAEEHHRRSLLHFCFQALKDNVVYAHHQRIRRNLAHQQRDSTLLRSFWNLWQSRIEQKEERARLSLLSAAEDHYRITLLHKCIQSWLQYAQRKRYKQVLRSRADKHFQQRALPAAFQTWRTLWRWHQQESVLSESAARFHRKTVKKRVFTSWCQKMFQHQENRLAERMAILHAERQLLQRSWCTWHQQTVARQWQAVACAHHRRGQLRKAFNVWTESARGLSTEKKGHVLAAEFHSARLLHWAWNRWRECLALRGAEWQKRLGAELHYQHTLLRKALHAWGIYQHRLQRVLQEVAAIERRRERQLLRAVLHRWRENTLARVEEARKVSRATAHYERAVCSKVLVLWREAVSIQIYNRQQEDCAVREAQKILERGRLRGWLRHWRARAQQRLQLAHAEQHQRQRALRQALGAWKAHHRHCARRKHLQSLSTQLLAQTLSRACFHQWRQQLAARRREQQGTARALWFWAFSLQAKVWAAWLDFVMERRRKKARLERAAQVYHQQLLQEGVPRLLRFAAGMKAQRQRLRAQQQAQAAHSLQRAVRRCATLWKEKVLGGPRPPAPALPRRVTFEETSPHLLSAGDAATSQTKRPRAPREPWETLGSLSLAASDPRHLELNVARSSRKQPRRPTFLLEPGQTQRSLGSSILRGQRPEELQECGFGLARPAGSSPTKSSPAKAPTPLVTSSSQPPARPTFRDPELVLAASGGLELLPPSSRPCGAAAPARESAWPITPGLRPQAPSALVGAPDPHQLLAGDFTGTSLGPGSETVGLCLGPAATASTWASPSPWDAAFPTGLRQDGQAQPVAISHPDLEAELEGIQQQLRHCQITKENLWSYQRQARSLRKWLQLSREEPRPEEQEAEQLVQKELQEVELQIEHLAAELQAQRQPIRACIARVQALWQALC